MPLAGHDDDQIDNDLAKILISIHVPLAGHDVGSPSLRKMSLTISIHVPLAGHDYMQELGIKGGVDFNPRAPCGARRRRLSLTR